MNDPGFTDIDLSNWTVVIGGSAFPKALCKAFLAKGADIYSGYGMSETCPVLTLAHVTEEGLGDEEEIEIRCKTGRTLPLVDLRIVNEDMEDVPANGQDVGEIIVRSPWLTQGYLKDKRNSEVLWEGGYLHTGDVANIDEKNYVNITDRMKDVIKIGGEWISSLELEDVIGLHPAVAEVAVIGKPDEKWGEHPLALIKKKEDVIEKEILKHVQGYTDKGILTRQALLLEISFVEEIDKTSVGKINKKGLREKYLD